MRTLFRLVLVVWILMAVVMPLPAEDAEPTTLERLQTMLLEGEYDETQVAAEQALVEVEAEYGADAVQVAEVLDILLESRWRAGKADDESVAIGQRSLAIKRMQLGPADAGVGKTLHHLAVVAYFRNEFVVARERWEQAIEIRSAALGAEHPDVAESLNGLANLIWALGDLEEAEGLFHQALAIREAAYGTEDPRVSMIRSNLFTLMAWMGDYAAALAMGESVLAFDEASLGPDHPEIGSTLTNLADVYDRTGDSETARKMYERVIQIWRKSLGPDHYLVGTAMNNLAEQLRRSGELAEARAMFDKTLAVWEAALGPESPRVGLVLSNMSLLAEAAGDLDEAKQLEQRAAKVREAALGADHPDLSDSLQHLGVLELTTGDLAAARRDLERAMVIRAQSYGVEHPYMAETQIGLARLDVREGDSRSGLARAIESERIARDHLRLTGRSLAEEHALRYAASRARGLDLALSLAVQRIDDAGLRDVLDALVRSRAVVLDEMAERHRSASGSDDPQVQKLAEELAAARSWLANLTVRGLGDLDPATYRQFVEEARQNKDRAERALGAASAEFAEEQRRVKVGLSSVHEHLPAGSALVSYVLYDHTELPAPATGESEPPAVEPKAVPSYAALVLRTDRPAPSAVRLGTVEEVDRQVASWKRQAARGALRVTGDHSASIVAYRAAGDQLRRQIWDPLASQLEGIARVFVVPDGSLNLVSFAALPVGEDRYLIETDRLVHYLSAERDLTAGATSDSSGSGLLALGGPDYDKVATVSGSSDPAPAKPHAAVSAVASTADTSTVVSRSAACGDFRTLSFDPLPAALQEADEVVTLWKENSSGPDARVAHLSGAGATEAAFKERAGGRRVLHIATHGFFLGGDCASAPKGGRGLSVTKKEAPAPILNMRLSPLLLSGLALAGANRRAESTAGQEDGVLTAEELAGLDLSGVEWAVLSACDTGVGEIQAGEGVSGLRRAMQVAGVRTLIMSLWPVDDEATRQWMTALYQGRLSRKLDSAEAARDAGLHVLNTRRAAGESPHPFYWAAFVAAGDWH